MSARTLASALLFFVIGTSSVISFTSTNATSLYLIVSAGLSVAVFAAIFAFRGPLDRLGDYRVRAAGIVTVIIAANLLRILTLDELQFQLEVTGTRALLTRMASATLITLAGMLVFGELAHRRARFTAAVADLTAQSEALSLAMSSSADRLKQAKDELQAGIRTVLDPVLAIAAREVGPVPTTDSALTSARIIQDLLRVSVRPIIETLAGQLPVKSPASPVPEPQTSPHQERNGTIDIHDSIRPVLGVVPLRIIGFPFVVAILPVAPAIRAILILTLTWPILSAIRRLWPARFRILPTGRAVVALTLTYLVAVGLPVMLCIVVSLPSMNETFDDRKIAALLLWAMAFFVANAWFASAVFIFERSRRLTEARLIGVNDQIELSIARLRQQIWYARQNLTWVLHGPVQSALVSAALRLQSGDDLAAAERSVLHENIVEAYAKLDANDPSYPDFARFSTGLARVWSGICEIEIRDPDVLIGRLGTDPAGTASLIEITTESVSNAISHGHATSLTLTLRDACIGVVTLTVTDNGTGMPLGSRPGIGSDLYDSLTHEWALTSSAAGTTLTAHVPWRRPAWGIPQSEWCAR